MYFYSFLMHYILTTVSLPLLPLPQLSFLQDSPILYFLKEEQASQRYPTWYYIPFPALFVQDVAISMYYSFLYIFE